MNRAELTRPQADLNQSRQAARRLFAAAPAAFRGADCPELESHTGRLAGHFAALGLARGDRVAFLLGDFVEAVECHLAIERAGGIGVPIDAKANDAGIAYVLSDTGVWLVVTDAAHFDQLDRVLSGLSRGTAGSAGSSGITVLMIGESSHRQPVQVQQPLAEEPVRAELTLDEEAWQLLDASAAEKAPVEAPRRRDLWQVRWQAADRRLGDAAGPGLGRRWAVIGREEPGLARIAGLDVEYYADFDAFAERRAAAAPDVIVLGFADHDDALQRLGDGGIDPLPDGAAVVCVTRGAVAAGPGETADPTGAAVWAWVRALRSGRTGRLVLADFDHEDAWESAYSALGPAGDELAVRQGRILTPRLVPVPAADVAEPVAFNPAGTVLITGAHTRFGRVVAADLAAQGVRRLILAAPTVAATAEAAASAVAFGAAVDSVAWHAGGADAAGRLLEAVSDAHPLTGVVHVAGPTLAEAAGTGGFLDAVFQHARAAKSEPAVVAVVTTRTGVLGGPGAAEAEAEAAAAFAQAVAQRNDKVRTIGLAAAEGDRRPGAAELTSRDLLDAFDALVDPARYHAGGVLLVLDNDRGEVAEELPALREAELIDELEIEVLLHLAAHEADAARS